MKPATRIFAPALAAAGLWLAAPAVHAADLAHGDRVPAQAAAMFSIPDTGKFWDKVKVLPTAKAVVAWLDSPEMKTDLDYQQFLLEKAKLEEKLGFKLTFDELFGSVLKDATLYASDVQASSAKGGLIAAVKDGAKAKKLVELFDEKAREHAAVSSPTLFAFTQAEVGGIKASHIAQKSDDSDAMIDVYYALVGDTFAMATDPAELGKSLGQTPVAAKLMDDTKLKGLVDLVDWNDGQVVGWVNGAEAMKNMTGTGMVGGVSPLTADAVAVVAMQVLSDGIAAKYASDADPAKTTPAIKPGKLEGAAMLGEKPLYAGVSRGYDIDASYAQLESMLADPMAGAMLGALSGGAAAGSPMAGVEQALGISIKNDLVPALGNEAIASFNRITVNFSMPMLSSADVVIGSKLRDAAKMKATMMKIETALAPQLAMVATPVAGAAPGASPFVAQDHNGTEVRTVTTMLSGLSPSYAVGTDYFLFGLTPLSVTAALDRKAGSAPNVTAHPAYADMMKLAGDNPMYDFSVIDIAQIMATVIQPVLAQQFGAGASPIPQAALNILATLDHAAAVQYQRDGKLVGQGKLLMR